MALLTYQISIAFWRVITVNDNNFKAMPVTQSNVDSSSTQLSVTQLSRSIINYKPFGEIPKVNIQPVKQEKITAPETALNYKLRGIYFSDNQLLSSAIIEIKNKAESYALNDEVEEGISIHSIDVKHIVLERYGKFETLTLEEVKFDKENAVASVVSQPQSNVTHDNLLKGYKERFVSNPMALARKFRSIPVTENGKTIGFKLKAVRGETLLKKLNVPENAVFTSINGVGLDKPFQALDALKSLQTAESVNVTFLLDGIEQSRDFNL